MYIIEKWFAVPGHWHTAVGQPLIAKDCKVPSYQRPSPTMWHVRTYRPTHNLRIGGGSSGSLLASCIGKEVEKAPSIFIIYRIYRLT